MKKTVLCAAVALAFGLGGAQAADEVTLQLKWVTQGQVRRLLRGEGQGLL